MLRRPTETPVELNDVHRMQGRAPALDKEHEHRNLPIRGSHIKTGDLSRDVLPQPMMSLTPEHRRALQLLAGQPHGCTEADMLTHGFELAALGDLIFAGFALAAPRDTLPVMWIGITEAGRKAIAE
jgi:hypothetical protein